MSDPQVKEECAQGRPARRSPRAGTPASHYFVVPTAPRAGSAHNELQCSLLTEPFPFVSVSVSLHLCLHASLALSCFPNILPEPLGSRAGGAGQWERDSVLFSPTTIRAGKGWSQGLARTPPPCLPWAPPPPI